MARKVKIDFTNVEAFQRASEGIHHVKISDIQEKNTQGGDPMLQVAFEIVSGDDKGVKVFDNLVLTDKALWKFKSLLQIIGMKCDGKVAVDLDNMIGKSLNINVTHEEYNGQIRARVSDYLKPGAAKTDDDEDEDSFDEEDVSEDEEEVEEEAPKPKKKPAAKKAPANKKPDPEEDEDDDWDEDEDDSEEEEKPAPKKAPAKKAPAKKAKKKPEPVEEDDEDDDDDWEEE